MKECNNNLNIYIKWVKGKNNVSKIERKEKIQKVLTTSKKKKPSNKNISYTNSPPKYMNALIPKTTPPFRHEWQRVSHGEAVISSSPEEVAPSSSSTSSLPEPSSLSSFEAYGERDKDAVKPPITACRHGIRPTRVFTWHNLSLRVSRRASMCISCAMMASRVTPPIEEEKAEVDGVEEVWGVTVSVRGYFGRS